jgi:Arc/MetJ-type ribon-helix-helix transcriptional regulator
LIGEHLRLFLWDMVMNIQLQNAELERFVQKQVTSGNFPSTEAVVEAALIRMMEEEVALCDEDNAEIKISQEQFELGKTVEFGEFAARMRRKFSIT